MYEICNRPVGITAFAALSRGGTLLIIVSEYHQTSYIRQAALLLVEVHLAFQQI